MVIERITGGKPQDIRSNEATTRKNAPATQPRDSAPARTVETVPSMAQVSERSKAAIKAYRIASETKPDFSRASRIGQIKAQIAQGDYGASSNDVATSIMKSVAKGV